jgi:Na+(H+)/acetate symporter ActP
MFTALLTAGAFAAFFATSLGLLLVVSSAVSHDLVPSNLQRLRVTVFWAAAVVIVLALPSAHIDAGVLVTWGFTVAASTFSPLLVLGIWWQRLTKAGAIAGLSVGLVASSGAIAVTLFAPPLTGAIALLVGQPAPWSVPLAFLTMVLVSLRGRPPAWATAAMLQLHLPINRPPTHTTRH